MGKDFFLNNYFPLKLSKTVFFFFNKFKFLYPFGFIDFLNNLFNIVYKQRFRAENPLFLDVKHSFDENFFQENSMLRIFKRKLKFRLRKKSTKLPSFFS